MDEVSTRRPKTLQKICGILFSKAFDPETVVSATRYIPRADDIFLATFPKCGTTWTQQILLLVLRGSRPPTSIHQLMELMPYLEVIGIKGAEIMQRPGVIKTHLPHHLTPWSDEAKYIYVARNPKDACVSYFYRDKESGMTKDFDDFFETFITGETCFGDYFDHLIGWYNQRNKSNVLFITYEYMKKHPRETILQIASFIDEEIYAKPLREDTKKLEDILRYSSFEYMQESFSSMDNGESERNDGPSNEMKDLVSNVLGKAEKEGFKRRNMSHFTRKGIVGDWRNHFSEDQNRRLNEKFRLKTKDTDLYDVWSEYI